MAGAGSGWFGTAGGAPSFFAAPYADTRWQGPSATWTAFGAGCTGSNGVPALSVLGRPVIGGNMQFTAQNLAVGSSCGFLTAGLSDQASTLGPLPFGLQAFGLAAGCDLLVSAEANWMFHSNGGSGSCTLHFLPPSPGLSGIWLYYQAASMDLQAPSGFVMSNVIAARLGLF
ncbi:MAG: hypothetical protein FJ265_11050 [Planctomycetes bacterium]|nr:hypothetical protein [Planctomycetota bacterium]